MTLEDEINGPTAPLEHFGRTWDIPVQRHLSHIKAMRDAMREGIGTLDLLVVETFLSDEQFEELLAIDPGEDELKEFADAISKILGTGGRGN